MPLGLLTKNTGACLSHALEVHSARSRYSGSYVRFLPPSKVSQANLHLQTTGVVRQAHYPLDRPHARRHPLRHGRRDHLHGPDQLPLRRLRDPHRLRPRLCSHHAQHPRRASAAARAADVRCAGRELGVESAGVRDAGDGGAAVSAVEVRKRVEEEE